MTSRASYKIHRTRELKEHLAACEHLKQWAEHVHHGYTLAMAVGESKGLGENGHQYAQTALFISLTEDLSDDPDPLQYLDGISPQPTRIVEAIFGAIQAIAGVHQIPVNQLIYSDYQK